MEFIFLIHGLHYHSIHGTRNSQKFNNIEWIFVNSHFFKKWATLEYIHTKNSRYHSNNIPTWHMETFWAMVLGSTYKYFWAHIVVKPMLMPPNNSNRHTHCLRGCQWTSVDHIKVKGPPKGIYVPFLWWALVVKFFMFASTLIKCLLPLKWSFPHQWWVICGQSKMGWAFPHHVFQWRWHIICNKIIL